MCNPGQFCHVQKHFKISSAFQSDQNVLFCLHQRTTSVLHLLEPWTATLLHTTLLQATLLQTIAAADAVLRTSHFHVSLTRPLGLETGSQHFALQKAVAVRVSTVHSVA